MPGTHSTKYLLIGGGLASSQAAKQIRQRDNDGSITLVSDEPEPPYDRPPLSKEFLRGELPRERLHYDSEATMAERGVELRLGDAVTGLDLAGKAAHLSSGDTIRFERALVATGGRPLKPHIPGTELPGVHCLRTLDQAAAIAETAGPGRRAVIVGAGFIGMEAAASLTQRGTRVTVIEAAPRAWARFADQNLSRFFQEYCAGRGITFHTGQSVTAIEGTHRAERVRTGSGEATECDFVLIAVGIAPNVELAAEAGLDVSDGIVVDQQLRTSHPDVFAAGDVVNYPDPIFGRRRRVEHWGHAEYCGQIAGQNMAGADRSYDLLTYVWSDIFDLHLEFAGDEAARDRVLVRGTIESGAFTILYLEHERLTAYFSVNGEPKEFAALKKLIRRGVELRGKERELSDPQSPLKQLL